MVDFALSVLERIEIAFEQCALAIDTGGFVYCHSDLANDLPETAPIRMRLLAEAIRDAQRTNDPTLLGKRERWVAVLDAIGAPPLVAAEVHWELARDPDLYPRAKRRAHAIAARAGFVAAGRTSELAAIDELLAKTP